MEVGENVEITVSGTLNDERIFRGKDIIRVIFNGGKSKGKSKSSSPIKNSNISPYITSYLLLAFLGLIQIIAYNNRRENKILF